MNGLQNWEEINEKWRIFAISVNKEVIVISDCSLFCELLSPNAADLGLIPGLGRSPGEGKGYPLQYSMDCIVHGVTNSWTRLSNCHSLTHSRALRKEKTTCDLAASRLQPLPTINPKGAQDVKTRRILVQDSWDLCERSGFGEPRLLDFPIHRKALNSRTWDIWFPFINSNLLMFGLPWQCRRPRFNPWDWTIPWRREWLPTPVFLPVEFQGQRSLVGYTVHGVAKSQTQLSDLTLAHILILRLPALCCIISI